MRSSTATIELSTVWLILHPCTVLDPPDVLLTHAKYPPGTLTSVCDGLAGEEFQTLGDIIAGAERRLKGEISATSDSCLDPPLVPHSEKNSGMGGFFYYGVIQYALTLYMSW